MNVPNRGLAALYGDAWLVDGVRTPFAEYNGVLGAVSPTDLGIKVAREVIARSGLNAEQVDSVLAGNMAPGDFDQFYVPRHIGLYAGVPQHVPALMVQRICGTGFELFRQAGEQLGGGIASLALLVGTESMSRNPVMAFDHRQGFKLGSPVNFRDNLWEMLKDPAAGITMIQTAENLARQYGITREEVDAFASASFAKAVAAQESGFLAGEIVPVSSEKFELSGYKTRGIRLAGKAPVADKDTHPRLSPPEVLAKLRAVYEGGVQTGGNSSGLTDGAAAALVANGAVKAAWGKPALARVAAVAVVGVPPETMGIGPAPAIQLLLQRAGLTLDDITLVEVNEAQGAQTLAVQRALELDGAKLNVNGGAIALGHPLAASGVRLTITAARELQRRAGRWAVASACIGGGQGIAVIVEGFGD